MALFRRNRTRRPKGPQSLRRSFVTPEGVDLQIELGGAGVRTAAFMVDAVAMLILLVLATIAIVLLFVASKQSALAILWLLGFFVLRNGWFALFEMGGRGATPGKRLMGLRVVAQWSGDGTLAEMMNTPKVKLNLLHCYRSMNYISRHMEEKYGIPWVEYNFFGPTKIAESLREIASHFDDTIKANAEKVIAKRSAEAKPQVNVNVAKIEVASEHPDRFVHALSTMGRRAMRNPTAARSAVPGRL